MSAVQCIVKQRREIGQILPSEIGWEECREGEIGLRLQRVGKCRERDEDRHPVFAKTKFVLYIFLALRKGQREEAEECRFAGAWVAQ